MIFVEGLQHRDTIWGQGDAAHLVSDVGIAELKAFAEQLRLPAYWLQYLPVPHYELNDYWRHRAIKAGAVDCAGEDRAPLYQEALKRYVLANREKYRVDRARHGR